jgi:hypothetical protein
MTDTVAPVRHSFVSCTGERLVVECVRDLPPLLADWRADVLADRHQRGPGRASVRAGRCLLLDETHAALEFAADDERVMVWSDGLYSDRYLDHLLRDHVVPRRLSLRGERILHATAVELDGLAVGFVGASTAGKSTLAAAGVKAGGRLLADDTLRLVLAGDAVAVLPTATRCRLRPDVASAFMAVADAPPMDRHVPVPLALLCVLERGAHDVELVPCNPAVSLVTLARSAFTPEASEVDPASVLDNFMPVVERTRVATLRYPNGLHALPGVIDLIRRCVGSERSVIVNRPRTTEGRDT